MSEYLLYCPCGSGNLIKNGFKREKQIYLCRDCNYQTVNPVRGEDCEIIDENIKLGKQKQRFQDTNRIERKSFRIHARRDNALQDLYEEYIRLLNEKNISSVVKMHAPKKAEVSALMQLSDLHGNEIVDIDANKYNLEIMGKRTVKYIEKTLDYLSGKKVGKIIVCLTGDLVNSDRRIDEVLAMATSRSRAMFYVADVLCKSLLMLNKHYNLEVHSVIGNESRLHDDIGWTKKKVSDNYDFIIYEHIKRVLAGKKGIVFQDADEVEQVITVNGKNFLLLHGHSLNARGDFQKQLQLVVGKYAGRNILIHYVLLGHNHNCVMGDLYSQGGTMVGSNAYSDKFLHFHGRASQNIILSYKSGDIDGIKVDLQEV